MYWLLIVYYNLIVLAVSGEVEDKCQPNGEIKNGTCKLITDCEVAMSSIKSNQRHPYARCEHNGTDEAVCCPEKHEEMVITSLRDDTLNRSTRVESSGDSESKSFRVAERACKEININRPPSLIQQIINGVKASLGEFPHMLALGYGGPDIYEFNCGASLLSELYALTAAHCVATLTQNKPVIARMGIVEINENTFNKETDYRILSDPLYHPGYSRRTKYHDLSLLRLERPVKFDSFLRPICLYTSFQDPIKPLTVTGWGTINASEMIRSPILMKANVTVVRRSKCNESYLYWRKLPSGIIEGQICAGDTGSDTCQGDSGGPLQVLDDDESQYRLVGVTSFGRGCGSTSPGVYTRVAHYIDWIESVVWPAGLDTWKN